MSEAPWSLVSIVIPARNAAATLGQQLQALTAQDYEGDYEVIVVDNGSTDNTVEVAEAYRRSLPQLRVVPANDRTGVNYVRNMGARAASGEVILICDADDVVAPTWIRGMATALTIYEAVGGPLRILEPYNPRVHLLHNPASSALPSPMNFLPRPSGCNCGVHAVVFNELGGFDESYAGGGDETEFFWRVSLAGFRIGFAEEGLVRYRLRDTVIATLKQRYSYARAKPRLYKDFRSRGMPPRPWIHSLKSWAWLVYNSPRLVVGPSDRRYQLLRAAVAQVGHVAGSIKHRVLYL